MQYEEWYHTVALQEYALETLQEECILERWLG